MKKQVEALTVRRVCGPSAHRAFVGIPYRLHEADARWVPPLKLDERRRWSQRHNASLATRTVERYLAYRGNRPVGRIAAIADPRFAARWERCTGLFGFFECENDPAAASALLAAAEQWLGIWGFERILGPVNLTTHDETGVLVDGFDTSPTVMSPHNPPHYQSLLEHARYQPFRDYHAYDADLHAQPSPVVARLVRALASGRGLASELTVRPIDMERWDDEVSTIQTLYNASFADVWGFVPISQREFKQRAARFRPIVEPRLTLVAERRGQPVGFSVTLPDINVALDGLHGRLLPFGWLKLARRIPRIRRARMVILGVHPDHVGRGIGAILAHRTGESARALRIEQVELSLVQGTNAPVRHLIDAFGCPITRTYRLYAKELRRATWAAA